MNKFTPTNRHNPCPICGDTSSRCREKRGNDQDLWLCMDNAGARKGEIINDHICVGVTRDGLWGEFVEHNQIIKSRDYLSEALRRRERLRRKEEREAKKKREEATKKAAELSAAERDRCYREILEQLDLAESDRRDLDQRGFTEEQITACGFKSVNQWQKVEGDFPSNLPGLGRENSLITPAAGYLCPVRDIDGLIVGMQLRKRYPKPDQGRYGWLSKGGNYRLNGEPPLNLVLPERLGSFRIGIIEGTGAKPFLAAHRLGIPAIGAAGGMHGSSPEALKQMVQQLQEALRRIAEAVGAKRSRKDEQRIEISSHLEAWVGRMIQDFDHLLLPKPLPGQKKKKFSIEVAFFPDAGSVENPNVMRQIERTASALKEIRCYPRVGWWGQESKKNSRDVDEISPDELRAI
ncbi:MAG: hypothetical protein F6J89_16010 [Symploca sp. SIO1C4]|uniref:DUF3854 domain-containing protein n=1 Tax=Symploca sp. SIO1C4 TaxID=2607765 RepID=A0A6B3NEN4_9CYAN|nr:hypothetical protein [Symploca sp. SIO1C4]